ncbi:hypothetical protein OG205_17480 [Lentzea sp. NBC_00516]|uniref:DUF5808 domain-containing protein n=1 Tax=Lentzea sp. NBC_00516 TaxID=2903582 RepID=UPI002E821D98|nr:DUF5808 domain-containing protein [Lentzea sp. NBC_00516]WUD28723.1 hypothetical protein OG205_17480 [Lentzea sp. NBC_00516]
MTTIAQAGWLVLVTAAFLVLPSTARPTLPFGIRVPHERTGEVRSIRVGYRVAVGVSGAAAVIATLLGVTGLTVALVVACLLAHWAAAGFVSRAKRSWPPVRQGVTTDTGLRTDPVRLPWPHLVPALVFVAGTAVLGLARRQAWDALWPVTNQAVVLVIAVLAAVTLPRARPDLDAARPESSARSYRAYLTGTLRNVVLLATGVIAALTVKALELWDVVTPGPVWTVLAVALVAVPFAVVVVWLIRAGDAGHRLDRDDSEDTGVAQRDDDRHWHVGGLVYANRADPALLVHQRVGSRWTLNLGHPASWLTLAALLVVFLLVDQP